MEQDIYNIEKLIHRYCKQTKAVLNDDTDQRRNQRRRRTARKLQDVLDDIIEDIEDFNENLVTQSLVSFWLHDVRDVSYYIGGEEHDELMAAILQIQDYTKYPNRIPGYENTVSEILEAAEGLPAGVPDFIKTSNLPVSQILLILKSFPPHVAQA